MATRATFKVFISFTFSSTKMLNYFNTRQNVYNVLKKCVSFCACIPYT